MNKRILFAIIFVLLFAVGIIIWFFFYSEKKSSPTLGETTNPLLLDNIPKRFQFIFNKEDAPVSTSITEVTLPTPQALTEIWNKPATGQTFIEKSITKEIDATSTVGTTTVSIKKLIRATSTVLMFVDRISGHIYSYNRETNTILHVSNTTIPGIYDAYIFDNGTRVVMRYEDKDRKIIVGVLATIPQIGEKDQARQLEGVTYLPAQVTSVAVSKNKKLLSYLVTGDSGGSIYTVTKNGADLIAKTPFREWALSYGGDTLYATTKPSAYMVGQTAKLPSFEFVITGKTGLMSNPSQNGVFLNSMWSSSGLKTFLSISGNQVVLPILTLASKCGWGSGVYLVCAVPKEIPSQDVEGLPDDWFQGRYSFDDDLMLVDIKTLDVLPLYYFDTTKKISFDVHTISVSFDNTFIAFNRKQNSSLWLLDTNLIHNE